MHQPLEYGEICPICLRKYYEIPGRRLNLSDKQIRAVIRNFLKPVKGQTRQQFCDANGLSKWQYRSIVYGRIKNQHDRARIDHIAAKLKHKIDWKEDG